MHKKTSKSYLILFLFIVGLPLVAMGNPTTLLSGIGGTQSEVPLVLAEDLAPLTANELTDSTFPLAGRYQKHPFKVRISEDRMIHANTVDRFPDPLTTLDNVIWRTTGYHRINDPNGSVVYFPVAMAYDATEKVLRMDVTAYHGPCFCMGGSCSCGGAYIVHYDLPRVE